MKENRIFPLTRSVLIEKCSKKNFIYNSELYLNSLGIAFYIWAKSEHTDAGYSRTFVSVSNYEYFETIIDIYGLNTLFDLYKEIISNEKLSHIPSLSYDTIDFIEVAFLDSTTEFGRNLIQDKDGENHEFQIYCTTKKIRESAGYLSERNLRR